MGDVETKNAKIVGSKLGIEDHGIFSCWLSLDYGGQMQGFGGYGLDEYQEDLKERKDVTGVGLEFIRGIMNAVGVENWEDLQGKVVRVKADYGKVYAIGNFLEDKWFVPKNFFNDYEKKEKEAKKSTHMPNIGAA